MPAAELFGCVAVPAAVAAAGHGISAVCAVGDCDPAASAINRGSGSAAVMRGMLLHARQLTLRWMAVSVPRDFNLDADRLSHPSQLDAVKRDAMAAGFVPHVVRIPPSYWRALRDAVSASTAADGQALLSA